MSKQATLFQSWGARSQKQIDAEVRDHGGGIKRQDEAMEDDMEDEDLLLAMAMEESLKDIQQPGTSKSTIFHAPPVKPKPSISNSKKNALMQKQSQLFKHVQNPLPVPTAFNNDTAHEEIMDLAEFDEDVEEMPDVSNIPDLPGFDKYAGRMWIYPTNYPVREYQHSIVKEALFKNTLVVVPTGLGKTFIAAVVMYNFYRWYPQGKVIFMAPTKPLVAQQIEACYNIMGIPQADTAEMTGAMQPTERQKSWRTNRVFFLTPQVLTNDLSRSACPADQVKCLVVDEAHKALGNHAYCQVVRELVKHSPEFRVLALSATPGSDIKAVQQVLTNLLISHVELRSEDSKDLQRYTHERKVDKIVVPLGEELSAARDKYLLMLDGIVSRLKQQGVLYSRETKSLSKFLILKARDAFRQNPPQSLQRHQFGVIEGDFALCMSLYHGYELLQLHGLRSLYNFLEGIASGEKSYGRTRAELQKNTIFCELLQMLRDKFDPVKSMDPNVSFCTQDDPSPLKSKAVGHPKMERLETIVVDHFEKFKDAKNSDRPMTRIMIFSQYRDSVNEITEILNCHRPLVKVMSFVGQSSAGKSTRGFSQREQLKVMKKFRDGGYNTLVSTCVGEEGLDIGDVDLIVCFDAHKSPIRLVQRMGRTGRKREGRIVMLVTEGKEEQIYNQSQYNKKRIHKAIVNGARSLLYYGNNSSMIPCGLKPICHKMHLTIHTKYEARTKSKANAPQKNKLTGVAGSKTRSKAGLSTILKSGFLSESQLRHWSEHYKLPEKETTFLAESEFVTLPPLKNKLVPGKGPELSLNEWTPWQNTLQPTNLTGHSDITKHYVQLMQFLDLQSAVGPDEDNYGEEMRMYLNEDDVLKPGQTNHMTVGNHGILKFCCKDDAGSATNEKQKCTDADGATKSRPKRKSDPLPMFDDEPVSLDSDDDLPTIEDFLKLKDTRNDAKMTDMQEQIKIKVKGKSGGHGRVKNESAKQSLDGEKEASISNANPHKAAPIKKCSSANTKLKGFQFVERNVSNTSEAEEPYLKGAKLSRKKKRNSSGKQSSTSVINVICHEDDDHDFENEDKLPNFKAMNADNSDNDIEIESAMGLNNFDSLLPCEASKGLGPPDREPITCEVGERIHSCEMTMSETEEMELSELLPIPLPKSNGNKPSPGTLLRIKTPPLLEDISCAFAELDKKGHISPVDILDMVDTWTQSRNKLSDSVLTDLQEESMICSRDVQNHSIYKLCSDDPEVTSLDVSTSNRNANRELHNSDTYIEIIKTGSSKLSVTQSCIAINTTEKGKLKDHVNQSFFDSDSRQIQQMCTVSDACDNDSLSDSTSLLCHEQSAIKRNVKSMFKKQSSSDSVSLEAEQWENSKDVHNVSVVLKNNDVVGTSAMDHIVKQNSTFPESNVYDSSDFSDPFTLEATSQKCDIITHDAVTSCEMNTSTLDNTLHQNSPPRILKQIPANTSTPMLPPRSVTRPKFIGKPIMETPNVRLSTPCSSLKDAHSSFFEEINDSVFAGVSFSDLDAKPESSYVISQARDRTQSQITFTQAMACVHTNLHESHLNFSADKDEASIEHIESMKTISREISNNESHCAQSKNTKLETAKIDPVIITPKDMTNEQPQFDLGFDIDLDDFEDEIIPPSPDHVIRPPLSQRIAISVLKSSSQTTSSHPDQPFATYSTTHLSTLPVSTFSADASKPNASASSVNASRSFSALTTSYVNASKPGRNQSRPATCDSVCSSNISRSSTEISSRSSLDIKQSIPVFKSRPVAIISPSNSQGFQTDSPREHEIVDQKQPMSLSNEQHKLHKSRISSTSRWSKSLRNEPGMAAVVVESVEDSEEKACSQSPIKTQDKAETLTSYDMKVEQMCGTSTAHSESDDADESIIQIPRKNSRAAILTSPDTPISLLNHSPESDPFKTPLKPAIKSAGGKRPRVSSEEESPLVRPRAKKVILLDDCSFEDDFVAPIQQQHRPPNNATWKTKNCESRPVTKIQKIKKIKSRHRRGHGFIEHEAELSESGGSGMSADESEGSDLDQYDNSFINDMSQMSQAVDPADMRAVYLQSVRSPAHRGRYKMAYGRGADIDVFSQVPPQDSEYLEDSFCVDSDCEDTEYRYTEAETSVLEPRHWKRNQRQENKFAELRARTRKWGEGMEKESVVIRSIKTLKDNGKIVGQKRRIVHTLDSSSDDEVADKENSNSENENDSSEMKWTRIQAKQTADVSKLSCVAPEFTNKISPVLDSPMLSLKSRLQIKLKNKDTVVNKNKSFPITESQITSKITEMPSLQMRSKLNIIKTSTMDEKPTFALGMDGLDFDDMSDDDNVLVSVSLPQQNANEQSISVSKLHQNISFKLPNQTKQSSHVIDLANDRTISGNLVTAGVQSREERLRLSRLKREEFRKNMAQQNVSNKGTVSEYSATSHKDDERESDVSIVEDVSSVNLSFGVTQRAYQSIAKNTSIIEESSLKQNKEKMIILIDSREISSAQDLVSILRFKHNLHTSVKSLGNCDYILSKRMAVERKVVSDFTNGANKAKLLERLRVLCEMFDRPCVIVEKDRVKPGTKESAKPFLCSKYVEHVVTSLAQTHIKLLYSESQEDTAAIMADLCVQEHKKNMAISVNLELSLANEQVLKFYLSLPKVSYILGLCLLHKFKSITEFIKSPIIILEKKGDMSRAKAQELHTFLRHNFDLQMLKADPR